MKYTNYKYTCIKCLYKYISSFCLFFKVIILAVCSVGLCSLAKMSQLRYQKALPQLPSHERKHEHKARTLRVILWVLAYFLHSLCALAWLLCQGAPVIAWLYFLFLFLFQFQLGIEDGSGNPGNMCVCDHNCGANECGVAGKSQNKQQSLSVLGCVFLPPSRYKFTSVLPLLHDNAYLKCQSWKLCQPAVESVIFAGWRSLVFSTDSIAFYLNVYFPLRKWKSKDNRLNKFKRKC